ncbi:hypothetical protein, partial [Microcoleus anatoxicus]|uniref:hypothetical protein n=1 Tax=Microcoleus anatoxicus TaxID=2705319 RepID=UPI0030C9DAAA
VRLWARESDRSLNPCLKAKVLSLLTEEKNVQLLPSSFRGLSSIRQGFQPLSDYRFDVKLTPMGSAVSLPDYFEVGKRHCRLLISSFV